MSTGRYDIHAMSSVQQPSIDVPSNARESEGEGTDVDMLQSLLMTRREKCMERAYVDVHWSLLTRLHEKHTNQDRIDHVT